MLRCAGGKSVTSRPSMRTLPLEAVSSPAMILNVVDFPQPDGPSSTQKLPDSIFSWISSSAVVSPQRLATSTSWIDDIRAVYGARGQSGNRALRGGPPLQPAHQDTYHRQLLVYLLGRIPIIPVR